MTPKTEQALATLKMVVVTLITIGGVSCAPALLSIPMMFLDVSASVVVLATSATTGLAACFGAMAVCQYAIWLINHDQEVQKAKK